MTSQEERDNEPCLLFNHLKDLIDANDKRYVGMHNILADAYKVGHTELVKRVSDLNDQIMVDKGKDSGYHNFFGYLIAMITIIVSVGVHFVELDTTKSSPVSMENNALLKSILIKKDGECK